MNEDLHKKQNRKAAPVGTTAETLSEHDKCLISLREVTTPNLPFQPSVTNILQQGKGWSEIDKIFETMTGTKPAATTLRKRFGRIKAALARVKPDDVEYLKQAHAAVNAEIEEEIRMLRRKMWGRVAERMVELGTEKYETATLEKEWKSVGNTAGAVEGAAAEGDEE